MNSTIVIELKSLVLIEEKRNKETMTFPPCIFFPCEISLSHSFVAYGLLIHFVEKLDRI